MINISLYAMIDGIIIQILLIFDELLNELGGFLNQYCRWISPVYYPPTKSEGYIFGVVYASVRPFRLSTLLAVCNHILLPIGQI